MPSLETLTTQDLAAPTACDAGYYSRFCGAASAGVSDLTRARAQAIVDSLGVPIGGSVLEYGCGLGDLTGALKSLGFAAVGVDSSTYAIANVVPEAQGCVQELGRLGLAVFPSNSFHGLYTKDCLEHVPVDAIPSLCAEFLRLAPMCAIIVPTADTNGNFVIPHYNADPTHATRLTAAEWLTLLGESGGAVQNRPDLTSQIRRADKVAGTLCAILTRAT